MTRRPPCPWLGRDDEGRPFCVHGSAFKMGDHWRCRENKRLAQHKWETSEKGREVIRRRNATEGARSSKALYELTRVRVSR